MKETHKNVIITEVKSGSEGVSINLNEKTTLKTGKVSGKLFWVSWDKIGKLLFDNYTEDNSVEGRNKLRQSP